MVHQARDIMVSQNKLVNRKVLLDHSKNEKFILLFLFFGARASYLRLVLLKILGLPSIPKAMAIYIRIGHERLFIHSSFLFSPSFIDLSAHHAFIIIQGLYGLL